MITTDLAATYWERYHESPEHLMLLAHAQNWDNTIDETPDGWTADTCTAYRMAMEGAIRILAGATK